MSLIHLSLSALVSHSFSLVFPLVCNKPANIYVSLGLQCKSNVTKALCRSSTKGLQRYLRFRMPRRRNVYDKCNYNISCLLLEKISNLFKKFSKHSQIQFAIFLKKKKERKQERKKEMKKGK